jgi:DNA polymerase III epsilon subunit-like protein
MDEISSNFRTDLDTIIEKLREVLYQEAPKWSQIRNPPELFNAEQKLQGTLNAFQTNLFGTILKEIHRDTTFVKTCKKQAFHQCRMYSHGWRSVLIRTLGGRQTRIKTPYLRMRKSEGTTSKRSGGHGVYPVLRKLGIVRKITPRFLSETNRQIADGPSGVEAEKRLMSREIMYTYSPLWRHVRDFSSIALWQRQQQLNNLEGVKAIIPPCLAGKRVVVGLDGGRIRIRIHKRRVDCAPTRDFTTDKCEPKLFVIYTLDERGNKEHDGTILYDGTIQSVEHVLALLKLRLLQLGIHHAELVVFLGDGARWIWNLSAKLQEELQLDKVRLFEIVDFFHAVGKLTVPSKLAIAGYRQQQKWFKDTRRLLKKGRIDEVIEALQHLDQTNDVEGAIRKAVDYFITNKERMKYAQFRAEKLPIGSGIIESGIRRIVNLRMKNSSTFWSPENAEAILYLRCQEKSYRWDEFFKSFLSQWAQDMRCSLTHAYQIRKSVATQFLDTHPPINIDSRKEIIKWANAILDNDNTLILDTETTGLDENDEIIQVAIIDIDGCVLFDSFLKPMKPVHPKARMVHKITDDDLERASTFSEVYDTIAQHLTHRQIVAYNVDFDRRMLKQTCQKYGFAEFSVEGWDCVMVKYGYFWGAQDGQKAYKPQSLTTACAQQEISILNAHHAMDDCLLTLKLIRAIANTR